MKITVELSKKELDLLLRGLYGVMVEENTKSHRPWKGYTPTKNLTVAEPLEARLRALSKQCGKGQGVQS